MITLILSLIALVGLFLIVAGTIRVGSSELHPPYSTSAGVLLMLPLPIGLWAAFATGFFNYARMLQPQEDPGWLIWVAPIAAAACSLLAGAAILLGLVAGKPEPPVVGNPIVPSEILERAPVVSEGIRTSASPAWNTNFPTFREEPPPAFVPPSVRRVRAQGDALPPEILALGKAERLHRAGWLARLFGSATSYVVYPGALVIASGDDYDIIPWTSVEVFHGRTLQAEGLSFTLSDAVGEASRLRQSIRNHTVEHLAASAEEAIARGDRANFGPFAVDSEGLTYRGKRAEWKRITGLDSTGEALVIEVRGFMMPWTCPLADVPNAHVLLETIRRTCPKRLLEAV